MTMAVALGCSLLFVSGLVNGQPPADKIASLPGWEDALPSDQYSGYLQISNTKFMHYWFVESEGNPASDPVVLWLNGGPGCSSLDGFIYEHGPFAVNDSDYSQLLLREYRWNLNANMLYLESPVGVGFSYSTDTKEYNCNDVQTADDNLASIEMFLKEFPAYAKNDFWIFGESYGGVYVPTLASAIQNATKEGTYTGPKLLGIAVGNGCTGTQVGVCSSTEQGVAYNWRFLTETPFIPFSLKSSINALCNWELAVNNTPNALSADCYALLGEAKNIIGNINLYDIYGDCINAPTSAVPEVVYKAPVDSRFHGDGYKSTGPVACINSAAASGYLNQPSVWAAIHVKNPGFTWGVCQTAPGWHYTSTYQNLPRDIYPSLIKDFDITIYNGDWDACVPYTDNEAWTEGMGLPVKNPWHAWSYTSESGATNQVGGYATQYVVDGPGFQFITIKNGRHEVPETAPVQAITMLDRILNGGTF